MNQGRYYHASCGFNTGQVYVFCGISTSNQAYSSTIERLNVEQCLLGKEVEWEDINLQTKDGLPLQISARQGLGATQYDD